MMRTTKTLENKSPFYFFTFFARSQVQMSLSQKGILLILLTPQLSDPFECFFTLTVIFLIIAKKPRRGAVVPSDKQTNKPTNSCL